MFQRIIRHKYFFRGLGLGMLLILVAAWLAGRLGLTPHALKSWLDLLLGYLKQHPVLFLVAFIILPSLAVPVTPFYVLTGVVIGQLYGLPAACAAALASITINMAWTYWIAAYPFRNVLENLLRRTKYRIPEVSRTNLVRFTVVMRITPVFPFFIQTYVLGITRVPFKIYLLTSILVQGTFAVLFVVSGGAIFQGQTGLAVIGITLIVSVILLVRMFRTRLDANVQPSNP